jgi:hypothetical protein
MFSYISLHWLSVPWDRNILTQEAWLKFCNYPQFNNTSQAIGIVVLNDLKNFSVFYYMCTNLYKSSDTPDGANIDGA